MQALPKTAEIELLLLCARPEFDSGTLDRARELLSGDLDPAAFTRLTLHHGLAALASVLLTRAGAPAEHWGEALALLKSRVRTSTVENMIAARDACEVTRWLDDAGIEALVFKGPALGWLYDTGLREFGDIDVLVRPRDVARSRETLRDRGYEQTSGPPDALLAPSLRYGSELVLQAPGRFPIDLHWRLAEPLYPFAPGEDQLWGMAQRAEVGEGVVRTLGPECLLLYLCFHGGKHHWDRFLWLSDLGRLIAREQSLDWQRVAALATRVHARRMLVLGLTLVKRLLGQSLPPAAEGLVADAAGEADVQRLVASTVEWIGRERSEGRKRAYLLRALDRRRDRVRFLLGAALRPTIHEWEAASLPPALYPLYSGYRLLRLAAKYARPLNRSAADVS